MLWDSTLLVGHSRWGGSRKPTLGLTKAQTADIGANLVR